MFNRVSAEKLQPRLDADFYKKEFIANDDLLKASGAVRLSSLIDVAKSSYGVLPKSEEYVASGVPLIRGGDLSFGKINPPEVHAPTSYAGGKGTAEEGDILILIKGACIDGPEGVARVSENEKGYIFNGSCYRLAFKNRDVDGYFFVAYSQARQFLMQKKRQVANTGISYNDEESILGYLLPNLQALTKKYIGDKVRQAERLRAWAKALEVKFELSLKQLAPEAFENRGTGRKYSRASIADISYTLNPGAFDEERLRVQHYLLGLGGKRFSKLVEISGATTSAYKPDTTYVGLDAISSNTCQLAPSSVEEAEISGTCRLLGEGPVIAKLRPYLNKVSYIPKRFAGSVGSTELLCIKPRGQYSGWYVYGVLKSELALKQLRPLATGATHPRIDQYDVYDLVVPVSEDQEILGQLLETAQSAYFLASELTAAAKFLVEALIEGQLTETELIAAEQALQAGNDQLDRRILNRLKIDGVDGQGPALFGDLDELYHLLKQAEGD